MSTHALREGSFLPAEKEVRKEAARMMQEVMKAVEEINKKVEEREKLEQERQEIKEQKHECRELQEILETAEESKKRLQKDLGTNQCLEERCAANEKLVKTETCAART